MIELDGSFGEGGGQILRTSLALALLTRQAFHLSNVRAGPCFHFLSTTWRSYLDRMGMHVSLRMLRPGFYPRGGGLVQANFQPCARLQGLHLAKRSAIKKATGFSAVAGLPDTIAQRQARRATHRL